MPKAGLDGASENDLQVIKLALSFLIEPPSTDELAAELEPVPSMEHRQAILAAVSAKLDLNDE